MLSQKVNVHSLPVDLSPITHRIQLRAVAKPRLTAYKGAPTRSIIATASLYSIIYNIWVRYFTFRISQLLFVNCDQNSFIAGRIMTVTPSTPTTVIIRLYRSTLEL